MYLSREAPSGHIQRWRSFTASRDIVDPLQLELSAVSPKEHSIWANLSATVAAKMLQRYGRFMPLSVIRRAEGVADRIIVTDTKGFIGFRANWPEPGQSKREILDAIKHFGQHYFEGSINVLQTRSAFYKTHKYGINTFFQGSEDEIQEWLRIFAGQSVIHETIHQFHRQNLPAMFLERGTVFYQKEVSEDTEFRLNSKFRLSEQEELDEAKVYEDAISYFGNDIHRVFFGSRVDSIRKTSVLYAVG